MVQLVFLVPVAYFVHKQLLLKNIF